MTICKKCGVDKPVEAFRARPESPTGRRGVCRPCERPSTRPARQQAIAAKAMASLGFESSSSTQAPVDPLAAIWARLDALEGKTASTPANEPPPVQAPKPTRMPDLPDPYARQDGRPYTLMMMFDVHIPEHDKGFWGAVMAWLRDNAVDEVGLGGDFAEAESLSQHGGNPRPPMWEEDKVALKLALREIKDAAMVGIRKEAEVTDLIARVFHQWWMQGNHCDRLERLLAASTPTLTGALSIPEDLGLAELGIRWVPYDEQPMRRGTLDILHGDQMASRPGGNLPKFHTNRAIELYGERGRTVIYGHTHKSQSLTVTKGEGQAKAVGMGCGRTLHPKWHKAPTGWGHQFAVAYLRRDKPTQLYVVDVEDGEFVWAGKVYSGKRTK